MKLPLIKSLLQTKTNEDGVFHMTTKKYDNLYMKSNLIFILLMLMLFKLEINAQDNNQDSSSTQVKTKGCFDDSTKLINVGIGLGARNYFAYARSAGYFFRSSPALSISYEQALRKRIGPGLLSVGGYLGYQSAYLQYDNYYYANTKYYYRHNWRYILVSARGAYHLDILNKEKGELYCGANIGLRLQTYSYETNSVSPDKNYYELNNRSVFASYSFFIGGHWFFTNKIALFAEVGYGISYLTTGISFKL